MAKIVDEMLGIENPQSVSKIDKDVFGLKGSSQEVNIPITVQRSREIMEDNHYSPNPFDR